jgi:hypothetical protein
MLAVGDFGVDRRWPIPEMPESDACPQFRSTGTDGLTARESLVRLVVTSVVDCRAGWHRVWLCRSLSISLPL